MTQMKGFLLIDAPLAIVGAVFIFLAAFCAPSIYAQGPPNSYIEGYYLRGATTPIISTSFLASAASCGQVKQVGFSTVDPTRIVWEDYADTSKDCIYVDA